MKSWKGWKGWGRESWKAKGEILMLVGIEENHPQHHYGGHDNDEMNRAWACAGPRCAAAAVVGAGDELLQALRVRVCA